MSLISDTPLKIAATQSTGAERWMQDLQRYAPWILLLIVIAVALYIYSGRLYNAA